MNWRQTLLACCLLFAPAWSAALTLALKSLPLGTSASVQAVFIEGVLQDGDGQKFQQFLANLEPATEQSTLWITLNSEGGSVREALNIARQIRNRGFITHVPAESRCISACLFLYAAGLVRVPGLTPPNTPFKPNIGIHRAFISRDFLARLSLSQAQDLTRAMYQSLERAFREFDIPPAIYQNALMTSSSQVRWLTEAETRSLGTYPAWFDEYLLARCEQLQTTEVARDATARSREKSACAMRVIQAHRRQVNPAAPTAPPPAAD